MVTFVCSTTSCNARSIASAPDHGRFLAVIGIRVSSENIGIAWTNRARTISRVSRSDTKDVHPWENGASPRFLGMSLCFKSLMVWPRDWSVSIASRAFGSYGLFISHWRIINLQQRSFHPNLTCSSGNKHRTVPFSDPFFKPLFKPYSNPLSKTFPDTVPSRMPRYKEFQNSITVEHRYQYFPNETHVLSDYHDLQQLFNLYPAYRNHHVLIFHVGIYQVDIWGDGIVDLDLALALLRIKPRGCRDVPCCHVSAHVLKASPF